LAAGAVRLFDLDHTHGRWPWAAAALAPAATALAWRKRSQLASAQHWVWWLPLPALLWHQTGEWVLPGGFLPWFNRQVLGSERNEFPINRRVRIVVNVGLGWGGELIAALVGRRAPSLAAWGRQQIWETPPCISGRSLASGATGPALRLRASCSPRSAPAP
jgi:hypothetical protein